MLPNRLNDSARNRIALYLQGRHREALESFEGWEWVLLECLKPRKGEAMKPTNNDVLGGYTKEVSCARCHKPRWVRVDVPEPYTCRRCRAVLAGRPADDPLGKPATPEQLERLRKAREAKGRRAV